MNLFNYLMAKKGHNTSVRDDLFAYLLGKRTPKEVKTATGTTISISDVTSTKIVSLTLSKESTQDGTPTPENPIEVKTVKGYRNLFDKDNLTYKEYTVRDDNGNEVSAGASAYTTSFVSVKPNTKYTISGALFRLNDQSTFRVYYLDSNKNWISRTESLRQNPYTFVTPQNCYYIQFQYIMDVFTGNDVQITESTEELPYVPYGNNYVAITNTNGTDINYYTIPLNDNEIVGKGINLDELIIDKYGHCFINKKFAKIDSYNGETITTDYWSTTGGLDTGATIYYVLATPQLIDLNYTVDMTLFKGINNISNSEDMDMTLKYY